jgi:hypothetical protein
MNDPVARAKAALAKLSGHYTLVDWSEQTGEIVRILPALIAEIETLRLNGKKQ